ncbi:hypothetical protein vseg_014449 [Gypsophila vaccaria]
MGMNLSPTFSQELANLGKDAESTKSAVKALTLSMVNMDSEEIPLLLAKVTETTNVGPSFGEHTISLFEVLARVYGSKVVSHLDYIMSTITKTLTRSGGSFPLQQACSMVVPAIARYGIEPTTPEGEKRRIIHSLCKPLSDSLLSSQECLSCGASLCLKALVDCDNWRFASDEMVNEVCLKLTGALKDMPSRTNSHMGLVISLAKKNSFVVEAYARMLANGGLQILNCGLEEKNSQQRMTAIHMLHSLMKYLDTRSIFSELEVIVAEMEKCQSDPIPYVKGAAFEALETAKKLLAEKGSTVTDFDVVSMTGSNFGRSCNSRGRNLSSSGSRSPLSRSRSRSPLSRSRSASPVSGSPKSQTLDSFALYESYMDPPISTCQGSCNVNHIRKSVNRKLWSGSGCGDIPHVSSKHYEKSGTRNGCSCEFPEFVSTSQANIELRREALTPQRTNSQVNVNNIEIFSTPRKLLRSLQDDDDEEEEEDSHYIENLARHWSPVAKYDEHECLNQDGLEVSTSDSESVSLSKEVAIADNLCHNKLHRRGSHPVQVANTSRWKFVNLFKFVFLVIFVAFATLLWSGNQDRGQILVPT